MHSLLTATKAPERDWMPRLSQDGEFYCSPSCGGGRYCRKEWYDRAVHKAQELALRMGDGWEPFVHENLGWHYRVVKGITTIYEYEGGDGLKSYSAWIEPRGVKIGERRKTLKQFIVQQQETPEEALRLAQQEARGFLLELAEALAGAI